MKGWLSWRSFPRIALACSHVLFSGGEVNQGSSWGMWVSFRRPRWMGLFQILGQGPNKTWKILCALALETQVWVWILGLPLMNEQMDVSVVYWALWVCQEFLGIWAVLIHLTFTIILSWVPIYRNCTPNYSGVAVELLSSLTQIINGSVRIQTQAV